MKTLIGVDIKTVRNYCEQDIELGDKAEELVSEGFIEALICYSRQDYPEGDYYLADNFRDLVR